MWNQEDAVLETTLALAQPERGNDADASEMIILMMMAGTEVGPLMPGTGDAATVRDRNPRKSPPGVIQFPTVNPPVGLGCLFVVYPMPPDPALQPSGFGGIL